MKTNKFMLLLAVLGLVVSCGPSEILIDNQEPETQAPGRIGFETFVNKSTRADANNSSALNDFYPAFNVYGWKTIDGNDIATFDNVTVEYFAEDIAGTYVYTAGKPSDEWTFAAGWYYENLRYWDQMASAYQFCAYAPITASADVVCTSDGIIKIGTSTSPITVDGKNLMATPATDLAYKGFDKDYMTATSTATSGTASFSFTHLQAKFNIRVRLSNSVTTSQDISVKKIQLHNLGDKAYYVSNAAAPAVNGWTLGTASTTYIPKVETSYSLNAATNYHNHYLLEQLIIPQTIEKAAAATPALSEFTEACIYVEYNIGTEPFKSYTPLANIFDTSAASTYTFQAGNQYTLNINIGPEPINFTAEVSTWADAIEGNQNIN